MKQYLLPKDIVGNEQPDNKICTFDYSTNTQNLKNQITLTQNVFSFLMEGSKELVHYEKQNKIDNSQFLLIKSGKCLMTETLSLNNHYRSFLMFFDDEMLYQFIKKNNIKLNPNSATQSFLVFDYDEYIHLYVNSLIQLDIQNTSFNKQILSTKFDELFLYLIHKNGTDFISNFLTAYSTHENHFTNIVENNRLTNLSIEELAFLCNTSISTFKREFKKIYNETPIKWFQEKRLEHAAFLLEYKKIRPSDVYEEIGYENLSSFIQAYKKKFGKTPKQHFV
ncbi:AraC family transcriptional regulator [Flavobacterium sp. 5]|uniref:helix-turn-helix domain-containing protein n=1 Tax=Flavobacterium sp. 5 TaxID=2035199 RepID=UPI000C2BFB1F|nr:AraC family transcriptional regulator [Flavobacterium sp. 5]PKB15176.1 AraC-like DNA-binding protein [Flavobacterium sp. 5]